MKTPFIQQVHRFEKRVLEWDGSPNQIPTKDKRFIWLDTTARWRIVDALKFYQALGTEQFAQSRLDDIIDSAARDLVTAAAPHRSRAGFKSGLKSGYVSS